MKVMEIRDHHSAALKKSKDCRIITVGLGLALSLCIGAYIGHTASQEVKTVERQQIHYVQEGETLWDIAGGVASNHDDIRRIIWKIQRDNDIGGNEDIQPGQRLIIKF